MFFLCFFNKLSGQILHHIYQNRKVLQTHSLLYRFYINRHELLLSTASSLPLGARISQQYLMSEIPRGSPQLDRTLVFAAGEGVCVCGGDSSLAAQLASPPGRLTGFSGSPQQPCSDDFLLWASHAHTVLLSTARLTLLESQFGRFQCILVSSCASYECGQAN